MFHNTPADHASPMTLPAVNPSCFSVIDKCRVCQSAPLELVTSLGPVPLADRLVEPNEPRDAEPKIPLTVSVCLQCQLMQLRETVLPEVLFGADYPYFSSFSKSWVEHCRAHAESLIQRLGLDCNCQVIEIASNDGYMLRHFVDHRIPVVGFEPAPGPAAAARAHGVDTRSEFFSNSIAVDLVKCRIHADLVIANNILAHVPDPNDFVSGVRTLLNEGGEAVFEVPYIRDLIDFCQFDTIYHEHLCYFSVASLRALFERAGLVLAGAERIPTHGGSVRLNVKRYGAVGPSVVELIREEQSAGLFEMDYYQSFAEKIEAFRTQMRRLVQQLKAENKSIAAYGAAAKGAMLLSACGLGASEIDFVVDRNVHKQGRMMPGARIPIEDPEILSQRRTDYLLLLPWNLKDEIVRQQEKYLNDGGIIIVPAPRIELIDKQALHQ